MSNIVAIIAHECVICNEHIVPSLHDQYAKVQMYFL